MENHEIAIKQNMALSQAIQFITNEYPEKFFFAEKLKSLIQENIIIITGDLDITKSEVYEKVIEHNGQPETYKIILKAN
jgi:hypothetical protein